MRSIILCAALLSAAPSLHAQGVQFDVGYIFRNNVPDVSELRGALTMPLAGPFRWGIAGMLLSDIGSSPTQRWGGGLDLTAFRRGRGPYGLLSLDTGFETNGPDDFWASWSAGGGWEVHLVSGLSLAADVRYRGFFDAEPGGLQVSGALSFRWGRKSAAPPPPAGTPPSTTPAPAASGTVEENAASLRAGVVASARAGMGKPYLYGGTGQGDDGFDCSGLIQYAYGQQGITLPRVSTQQAAEGVAVPKSMDALAPGDILTFSAQPNGSTVSHVGLYLGNGRFIHSSSSRGVMESALSGTDPNGQWWYVRWVGARRVIGT